MPVNIPLFKCGSKAIETAFRIAVGDICGNIVDYYDGRMADRGPVLVAGLDYTTPWTRDAAFNVWYALGLLSPDVARNTLLSVLTKEHDGVLRIGGEYWDAIIWAQGAWKYCVYTGDWNFARQYALPAIENSLVFLEQREFDTKDGLFRGGACFQDGISAYPEVLCGKGSGIMHMVASHPELLHPVGEGVPCKALSTNCLYYWAYIVSESFRQVLGYPSPARDKKRAEALHKAINQNFFMPDVGSYKYMLDVQDDTVRQEGLGLAFSILSGVASKEQGTSVIKNAVIHPHGIPCLWPTYERYSAFGEDAFGRHSGPIWPQVNTAWVAALVKAGERDMAMKELEALADKACRDLHFNEMFHPFTGKAYGGLQEMNPDGKIGIWDSCRKQSWCATGFINMVLTVLCGLEFDETGLTVNPYLPEGIEEFELRGLVYRQAIINIKIKKGMKLDHVRIPADTIGPVNIQ